MKIIFISVELHSFREDRHWQELQIVNVLCYAEFKFLIDKVSVFLIVARYQPV